MEFDAKKYLSETCCCQYNIKMAEELLFKVWESVMQYSAAPKLAGHNVAIKFSKISSIQ